MFTYKKLAVLVLVILLGVPSVSMAGSLVVSLVQGKTPAEAVQIIAEQLDTLIGRVQTLETKQAENTGDIEQSKIEIERLKLENENLRLKNDNLSQETERVAGQVAENEKAVDTVKQCEVLEKTLVCAQNAVVSENKQINAPTLSVSASLQEVTDAYGVPWYPKNQTDEICFKGGNGSENCKSKSDAIQQHNQDIEDARERAKKDLESDTENVQSVKPQFEKLQCELLLKKYEPSRKAVGCG